MSPRLMFAVSLWLTIWATAILGAEELVVQQLSASGTRNLRPFTVKDHWEIRGETKRGGLGISIHYPDGKLAGVGGSQMEAGSGSSYQPKGGRYYLEITSMSDWTITVVQLP